jgi:hypothetical protein
MDPRNPCQLLHAVLVMTRAVSASLRVFESTVESQELRELRALADRGSYFCADPCSNQVKICFGTDGESWVRVAARDQGLGARDSNLVKGSLAGWAVIITSKSS